MSNESSRTAATARAILLVLIAVLAVAATVVTSRTLWAPAGVFGWNIGPDGTTVIAVTPGYPAQRAGIRAGDRIVYATLPLRGRFNTIFVTPLRPGERLAFQIDHAGAVRNVTLEALAWPTAVTWASSVAGMLANLVSLAVGLMLVFLRPNLMTWAFLFTGALALVPFSEDAYNAQSDAAMAAVLCANFVLNGIAVAGAFVFIGRFPSCQTRPWTAWLDRAAIPWVLTVAACGAYLTWAIVTQSQPPFHLLLIAEQYVLPAAGTLIMLAALVANYLHAQGSVRVRILPVMAVFTVGACLQLVAVIVVDLLTDPVSYFSTVIAAQVAGIAFPLTVAYAVIRHRVMDINFVVSRTLVYGLLTAGIVAAFALVHYLVGKLLERTGLEIALELGLAIAYGVWLQVLHDNLDRWIDRVLFRRRHLAETRLERIGDALRHAQEPEFVDDVLVAETADALSLASTALFRRDEGGTLVRRAAIGWSDTDAQTLDGHDRIIVELSASLAPIDLTNAAWHRPGLPSGLAQPLYAIPICVEHRVEAVALYGGHSGGEALDPDERRLLQRVAQGAAVAYDHLASLLLARKVRDLENENAGLRHAHAALTEATQALGKEIAALGRLISPAEPQT